MFEPERDEVGEAVGDVDGDDVANWERLPVLDGAGEADVVSVVLRLDRGDAVPLVVPDCVALSDPMALGDALPEVVTVGLCEDDGEKLPEPVAVELIVENVDALVVRDGVPEADPEGVADATPDEDGVSVAVGEPEPDLEAVAVGVGDGDSDGVDGPVPLPVEVPNTLCVGVGDTDCDDVGVSVGDDDADLLAEAAADAEDEGEAVALGLCAEQPVEAERRTVPGGQVAQALAPP